MPKRILEGKVVSSGAQKTISVLVERRLMHPTYKKYITRSKKFLAHDETNVCQVGDVVRIIECRPLSRRKCWALSENLTRSIPATAA
jgi:small subunit ribosomal protein S17